MFNHCLKACLYALTQNQKPLNLKWWSKVEKWWGFPDICPIAPHLPTSVGPSHSILFAKGEYHVRFGCHLLWSFTDRDLGTGVDEKKERKRGKGQYPSGYVENLWSPYTGLVPLTKAQGILSRRSWKPGWESELGRPPCSEELAGDKRRIWGTKVSSWTRVFY